MGDQRNHWCAELYELQAASLILYGRALGLSHCEAEDVLQDTFMALLRLEEKPERPIGYCLRSFRNRATNYRRGLWRRLRNELEARRWFEPSESETPPERAAMQCLAGLPRDQREVIVLKVWQRYTFEDIAELLELSPNTVAGRYRYGMQKLRACLNEVEYERLECAGKPTAILDAAPTAGGS